MTNKFKPWTSEQETLLLELWPTCKTSDEIGEIMGRSAKGCRVKFRQISPNPKGWSKDHIEFLEENYPRGMEMRDISAVVKKSSEEIKKKAVELGLVKPFTHKIITQAHRDYCRQHAFELSNAEIARRLGISRYSVVNIIRQLDGPIHTFLEMERELKKVCTVLDDNQIAKLYKGQRYD